jgi:PqqD family protein of HPr-rel-A system
MEAAILYCVEEDDALLVRALDDLTLIYHRPAGQTHLVVSPVPEILAALRETGAASVETLHAAMARDFDLGEPAEALAAIERQLRELAALGLVRAL